MTLAEIMMYSTTKICMLNDLGQIIGSATGFFFGFCSQNGKFIPSVVTNRHVFEEDGIKKCSKIQLRISVKEKPEVDFADITVINDSKRVVFHPNENIDLAVVLIGPELNEIEDKGFKLRMQFLTSKEIPLDEEWKNLDAIEDITMVGYPLGLIDSVNNLPIFRRGITATAPFADFRGQKQFLADLPCFEGCSGSPVFLYNNGSYVDKSSNAIYMGNRLKLLGIQMAIPLNFIPVEIADSTKSGHFSSAGFLRTKNYMNIGFIIKSTELLIFEKILSELK